MAQQLKHTLTKEMVAAVVAYDPETGLFTWKNGRPAFTALTKGYPSGQVLKVRVYAHQVAWLLMTGDWPVGTIDHKDRNPLNNKWENLRDVPHQTNCQNQKVRKDSTTGVAGVTLMPSGKYRSRIRIDGAWKHLGVFSDLEQAVEARKAAEVKYGFGLYQGG